MRLILETTEHNKRIEISWSLAMLALLMIMSCLVTVGCLVTKRVIGKPVISRHLVETSVQQPLQQIAMIKQQAQTRLDAYGAYLANIQARMVKLDAMGQRLAHLTGINDEFDLPPAKELDNTDENRVGNKENFAPPSFMQALDKLSNKLATREKQLELIEYSIAKQAIRKDSYIAGLPVANANISSQFGLRIDPITGRAKGHKGIDFSAPRGTSIKAVAAGIVTFSGVKNGYGNVVEISHIDGYKTIYAHNQENMVKAGDMVKVQQTIAKVGSSGRATGSHLHFEVQKNNHVVNPFSYISRTHKQQNLPLIQTVTMR